MTQQTIQPNQITFFRHPIIASKLLVEVLAIKLSQAYTFSIQRWYLILILLVSSWCIVNFEQLRTVKEIGWFSLYWIMLGVASSIGLGTGLHTFVLYLGPHIAKVVVASIDCGYVPRMIPSRWNFSHFEECSAVKTSEVGLLSLLAAVQVQAFLWGLGTAIGQLPPYYISKEAAIMADKLKDYQALHQTNNEGAQVNQKMKMDRKKLADTEKGIEGFEAMEEIENLKNKDKSSLTLIEKVKLFFFGILKNYGFITILVLASVPNPLFDLAGITCGHFKIPFWTFFMATLIGKAIIKVHLQVFFIIFLFSERHVENLLQVIQSWFPFLENRLLETMQKQKKLLFQPDTYNASKPLLARLWDYFLIVMILYFLMSIVTNSIQHHLIQKRASQKTKSQQAKSQ